MKESASSFMRGRLRRLSAEEIELWLSVAKTVSPRPSSVLPRLPPEKALPEAPPPPAPLERSKPPTAAPAKPAPDAGRAAPPPALRQIAPLERRLRQKLSRGRAAPDAVIDLHGLRRHEAFVALREFLARSQRGGAKIVLVVTGKGRGAEGSFFEDEAAGVLRRSVPHWLRGPDYHAIVAGFEEASRPHGGAGALYVRLRSRRPQQPE